MYFYCYVKIKPYICNTKIKEIITIKTLKIMATINVKKFMEIANNRVVDKWNSYINVFNGRKNYGNKSTKKNSTNW